MLTAGYWHTTYWAEDYWNDDYWQDYGLVIGTNWHWNSPFTRVID